MKLKYVLINNVNGDKHIFETKDNFIKFVRRVFDENEECTDEVDRLEKPNNELSAVSYVINYCGNFDLEEMPY